MEIVQAFIPYHFRNYIYTWKFMKPECMYVHLFCYMFVCNNIMCMYLYDYSFLLLKINYSNNKVHWRLTG